MLTQVPDQALWHRHIATRISEAMQIGLLSKATVAMDRHASAFIPRTVKDLLSATPDTPLRSLARTPDAIGWQKRHDLFAEAGFSQLGDTSLSRKPHFDWLGRAFYRQQISRSNAAQVTRVLRWSRSTRVLAAVAHTGEHELDLTTITRVLFLCDIFQSDSLAIVPL